MSNELAYQNGLKQISSNLHAPGRQVVGHDRIASMEGSRAYAIILVFLVHFMSHYFDRYNGTNFDSFHISNATSFVDFMGYYFWASHYGVDLFFLLSGFLIFRILARLDFRYFQFLLGRLLRLYPAFLFAFALQIFYAAYFWDKTFDASTLGLFRSRAAFHEGLEPIIARLLPDGRGCAQAAHGPVEGPSCSPGPRNP